MLTAAFALLEAATVQLVCIWFAGGALLAYLAGKLGCGITVQVAVFIITAAVLLFFTRPIVKKLLKKKNTETNLDRIIGTTVTISEKVDNLAATGRCIINGVSWSVRSDDGNTIEAGHLATILRIEGVRLIVKEKN